MMSTGVRAASRRRGLTFPTFASGSGRGVATTATSIPISAPTGIALGNLLVTFCMENNLTGTYTAPDAGWQHVSGSPEAIGCATFWKYATQTEVDALSFSFGRTTNTTNNAVGIMLRYTYGSGTPTPEKVNQTSASGTAIVLEQLTSLTSPGLLIHVATKVTGTSGAFTPPGGAEVVRMASQNTAGTQMQFIVCDEIVSAGDTGTRSYSYVGSSASRGALLALPAAA